MPFPLLFPSIPRPVPGKVGSLILLLHRSPLTPWLPEVRVLSTTASGLILNPAITVIAGLEAFDAVAGATEITQLQPAPGSTRIDAIAGEPLNFIFQATGTSHAPAAFQLSGDLPPGLTLTGLENSWLDSITGIPGQAGSYPVRLTAWQLPGFGGEFIDETFTFHIVNPPPPAIVSPPAGGNYPANAMVLLAAAQTGGKTFTWQRNGEDIAPAETLLVPRGFPRRYRPAPATDPGPAWFSVIAFDDTAWPSAGGAIGYDTVTAGEVNFLPFLAPGGNLQDVLSGQGKPAAVHLRMPFTLAASATFSFFTLRIQCDDGFTAWLNGTEIASQNKPSPLQWNSAATADAVNSNAVLFREFDLAPFLGLLRQGDNLLAIQAMNRSSTATGNDFLCHAELAAGINAANSPWLLLAGLQTGQTGSHSLTATNPAGSVTTTPVPVLLLPEIAAAPEPVTIAAGESAQLNVTPGGSPPFSFQWFRGESGITGDPVAGAEEETLFTPPLRETTRYWVRISSPAGTVDSPAATVTVLPPAADGYPAWAAAWFPPESGPALAGPEADPDGDALSNASEYVFGTPPLSAGPAPSLRIRETAAGAVLSFPAPAAAGPGYTGLTRFYTVQSTTRPDTGPWTSLPAGTGIAAASQILEIPVTESAPRFYRLKVELQP